MSLEPGSGEFLERLQKLSPRRLALLAAELQRRLSAQETPDPIAVIGMACRLPGGVENPEAFWKLLAEGVDAIEPVPADRWDADVFYDPSPATPGKTNAKWGGFVKHIDQFDAGFFGISPREAVGMDPQQRMLLEVTWEALERAGVRAETLNGTATGMFAGLSTSDYASLLSEQADRSFDAYSGSGIARSVAVGRISYVLGLKGPNLAVDTACSSSAMAIHLACQSLRHKECSLALAGGVNAVLVPQLAIMLSQAQMLSADGRCKTFAQSADGFVRSEGCGILVLRRLSDAQANGDRILGVIRGSAVNHDGRSSGLTAPNGPSQEAVIREALRQSRLHPADVDYLEAHGTGTVLGDAIELGALNAVFSERGLTVGSVKTNIGHLEAAAGVAAVIKVLLSLQNEQIPPHLHVADGQENEALQQLQIPQTSRPWRRNARPRVAGVSSFGFSGTNVHLVLEEAPVAETVGSGIVRETELITVSAKSPRALESLCHRYAEYLREHPATPLGDFARTVNAGRSHFPHRIALLATSIQQIVEALTAASAGVERHPAYRFLSGYEAPSVAFLFTGQGSQYPGMGQALFRQCGVFRTAVERGDEVLRGKTEYSLSALLNGEAGVPPELIHDTAWTQPALFLFEYALAALWLSWGVRPSHVLGHSLGEYVAACMAGVLSFEDALTLAWQRGRLMAALPRDGAMIAVRASEADLLPLIAGFSRVAVAAVNAARSSVLSGDAREIAQLRESLAARGIAAQQLTVSHAFHSPLMDPMLDEFERIAQGIDHQPPQLDLISNVSGECLTPSERLSANYWRRHVRGTVRFADGIAALLGRAPAALLEIGPDPVLLGMAKSALPSGLPALPSLRKGKEIWSGLYEALRQLYLLGAPIAWEEVYRDSPAHKLELPTYPFERQRYWISSAQNKTRSEEEIQGSDPLLFTTQWQPLNAGPSSATPQELVRAAEAEFLNAGPLSAQYAEFLPQLNRLCSLYVLDTLRRIGVHVSLDQPLPLDALVERFPLHRRLLARMAAILCEDGMVEKTTDGWLFRSIPAEKPETEQATLLTRWPSFAAELGFLAQTSRMHEVLTGAASPLEVLFPAGSLQLAERVYQDSPAAQVFHRAVAVAVRKAVLGFPGGQKVRVLEVGAGTGSTTSYALPLLADLSVDYLFTDISPAFLEKARTKFSAFPFVRYATLDLESPAHSTNAERADVLVAANVLHATADLRQTLTTLRQMLAPGGILVLVEGTTPQRFGDLTVGMTAGWWRFTDTGLRPDYPLVSREKWVGLLREAGFETGAVGASSASDSLEAQQTILVARLPQTASSAPLSPAVLRLSSGHAGNKAQLQKCLQGNGMSPRMILEHSHLAGEIPQAAFEFASEVLSALQQVAAAEVTGAADVWLVLRDSPDGSAEVLAAMAEGMAKTAQIEHPHLRVHCVRLPHDPSPEDLSQLDSLLLQKTNELSLRLQNGKISVARLVHPEQADAPSWHPVRLREDAAWLITGGYGGLGLRTAEWMVDKGARLIFLVGRRSPSAETSSVLAALRARGARIVALTGDISQPEVVQQIFAEIERTGLPLRGVIHAAGTVDDSTLLQQSQAHLENVFAAKVRGAWLLHEATRAIELDFFVLYGSAASTLGSAGQANHAAANGFLDGLAGLRQQMGLPATAIAWGAWSEIGAATRVADTGRGSRLGLGSFSPKKGIELLEKAIGSGLAQVSALPVDWSRYLTQPRGSWPFFDRLRITSGVVAEGTHSSGPDLQSVVANIPSERRVEAISSFVRSRVALVLRLDSPAALRDEQPFPELGLDSLMAVELKNDLQASSGVSLPANFFFEFPTVQQAAAYLNAKMAARENISHRTPDSAEYEEIEL
ncbi:MAG TPA: type I polyketide synthase [Acidobacteriaceae bacterium]|jgi:acyl transferase domain-containing protein/NAD(P)-dependent dehydrogenase (short-subunit alcohol dehydrogenase family)/SAM-dependent methyltransferase/acyl carrier protein|nr:type I polyketide synthase [Acidobacteriaceae bacterium]